MSKKFLMMMVLVSSVGCSKFHDDGKPQGQGTQVTPNQPLPPVVAQCAVDTVDYQLNSRVLGYEFVDEFNISFGFNVITEWFEALNVQIPLKKAQLVLSMNMIKPMHPSAPVAVSIEKSYDLNLLVKVNVDFGAIVLNPEFYYDTPLLNLTKKALDKTFQDINNQAKPAESAWNNWVVSRPSYDEVVIGAGSMAGVQVGDSFNIFNVEHLWTGEPCHSDYIMPRRTTRHPLAVARVERVTEQYSLLRFLAPYNTQEGINIKPGAIVDIANLATGPKEEPREPLRKTLRIGTFQSEKLVIKGKGEFDFVPIMVEQLKPIVLKQKYVLRQ